jgi:glycosyltransferase involved in cell wall biosynthesis
MTAALDIIGPYLGASGYDQHTRAFVRQFANLGVRVRLAQHQGWSTPLTPEQRDPWFETLCEPVGADTVLHFTMPNRTRPLPGRRNVNYTMFEADRIPRAWLEDPGHDLVVVPTESCRNAWIESGAPCDRVRVSPLGVDTSLLEPFPALQLRTATGRDVGSYQWRFLNIAELRPRKNHLGLIRAWLLGTRPDDDAVLIIKGTAFQPRAVQEFFADLEEMTLRTGKALADAAPLLIMIGTLSRDQIRGLFRAATHYWSMSRGEGWDLVMMEAAVSGLQLITPHHTAYLEYLRYTEAHWLPAPLRPATFEGRMGIEDRIFFDGLNWWDPDVQSAAGVIRDILDHRRGPHPSPAHRLASTYSWERVARSLLNKVGVC